MTKSFICKLPRIYKRCKFCNRIFKKREHYLEDINGDKWHPECFKIYKFKKIIQNL